MGFASDYLSRRTLFPEIINEVPDPETGLIAVIPAYNEPEIRTLLGSLAECAVPDCGIEIILVVNSPDNATPDSLQVNINTISEIETWKKAHPACFFRIYTIDASSLGIDGWNVGLARKTGMDEAVRRFERINNKEGAILSLDADCTVEKNYFSSLCNELYKRKERSGCSIYFEHPLSGEEFTESHYSAITLYELHLRYYFQGLTYSGFPYVHHTVGSSVAVKVLPYIKAGGMNRRMAGEDFYFIQKLVLGGGYFNFSGTTVYPSPRSSIRVPFGTGMAINKLIQNPCDDLMTYNVNAFEDLHTLFSLVRSDKMRLSDDQGNLYNSLPDSVRLFICKEEWIRKISEIKGNTSGGKSFFKRFFAWFNMFMIVKYMNTIHRGYYEKRPVSKSASELLEMAGDDYSLKDPSSLLDHYRRKEKDS